MYSILDSFTFDQKQKRILVYDYVFYTFIHIRKHEMEMLERVYLLEKYLLLGFFTIIYHILLTTKII